MSSQGRQPETTDGQECSTPDEPRACPHCGLAMRLNPLLVWHCRRCDCRVTDQYVAATDGRKAGRMSAQGCGAMTRWLTQTLSGGGNSPLDERGDCARACIASILGLPITALGNHHGEGWWDAWQKDLGRFGYWLLTIDLQWAPPAGLWVATLPSLGLSPEPDGSQALHCTVARGRELVHCPGLNGTYTRKTWRYSDVVDGWVLVQLDPSEDARQA